MRRLSFLLLLVTSLAHGVTVTDDQGRKVTLDQPARRIATLSPHATEFILALGMKKRLVAVADFLDYPDSIASLPRLSSLGGLDRERLLLLDPDLVIAWASGNRPSDLRWLETSGIPVFLSEPKELDDIAATLEKLGMLAGEPEKGRAVAREFRQRLANACSNRRKAPWQSVFWEIWPSPPMTIGGRHWLNQVLERARLRNLYADIPRAVVTLNPESLLARPHDLTIVTQPSSVPHPGMRVLQADATLGRPGPRIVEGLVRLCRDLEATAPAAPRL